MAGRLEGKVAYITGAGSGIARATAHLFTSEGARVILAEIDAESGRAAEESIRATGGSAYFVPTDVTDEHSVQASLDRGVAEYGRLDILFNCAGGSVPEDLSVTAADMSVWDSTVNLNLKGPFLCCRHGIPHLVAAAGGAIINVSSFVALKGSFRAHAYTAAKGGIISLTQALAGRYWRDNIRANVIAPGVILSDRLLAQVGLDADSTAEERIERMVAMMPDVLDRRHPFSWGQPEDIANLALFLASDESRMITGAVIPADGGLSVY